MDLNLASAVVFGGFALIWNKSDWMNFFLKASLIAMAVANLAASWPALVAFFEGIR